MARPANETSEWKYEVDQVPLFAKVGAKFEPTGFFGNLRRDNGVVLGVTTDQYAIMQNERMMETAHKALRKVGLTGADERITVAGEGARIYVDYTFRDRTLKVGVGDLVGYSLRLKNSFDRSIRYGVDLGFLRLACLNGMATLEKEFCADRKHAGNLEDAKVDFLAKAMETALKRGPEALKVFQQLGNVSLSDEHGLFTLGNLERKGILSGQVREGIQAIWEKPRRAVDKARNLYNLYNAATEYLTHEVAKERNEYASKTSGAILLTLANASRDKAKFAALIAPPKKEDKPKAKGVVVGALAN